MSKALQLFVFMTIDDELAISNILKENYNNLLFIDDFPWPTRQPVLKNSIHECYSKLNSGCTIINTDILDLEDYKIKYITKIPFREEYHGNQVGPGLIQVQHSEIAGYNPGGLIDGSFTAVFDPITEQETGKFVRSVFKILRKHLIKADQIIDFETNETVESSRSFQRYAGEDAIAKYDLVGDLYLTNNTECYFTSKKIKSLYKVKNTHYL